MSLLRGFLLATCAWTFGRAMTPRQPIGCTSSSSMTSNNIMVDDWVSAKCGPTGQQLWKYQGALYDPLDGRRVAFVEGLEWVSLLHSNETSDHTIYSQVLNHPNATWKCAASMRSQHLFCYTLAGGETNDENAMNNNTTTTQLLRTIRVRPYSPEKQIPLEQAAAVYETTTTLIERPNGDLLVYSEWPDSSTPSPSLVNMFTKKQKKSNQTTAIHVWGVAGTTRNVDDGTLGFSIFCKRRAPKSPLFLPDLTNEEDDDVEAMSPHSSNSTKTSMVVSPKRAKWIQFGISNMETKHKFGARETYSISNSGGGGGVAAAATASNRRLLPFRSILPWNWFGLSSTSNEEERLSRRLRYTRYGEGPPFYAPGRMCMLELQAEPIDTVTEASPVVQELLRTQVQGWNNRPATSFGQVNGGSSDGGRESLMPLQLLPEIGQEHQDRWTRYKGHALGAWERVRSVTNVVSFFRTERGFWTR